jgi:hypothetical protein
MREIKIPLSALDDKNKLQNVVDSAGRRWDFIIIDEAISITEIPAWSIYIEGILVGTGDAVDPGEAVREAFLEAGLTSMPEAVLVKASGPDGDYAIFTLAGKAYRIPLKKFSEEVENSSLWTSTRQAKRPEIDALMSELKKL